MKAELLKVIEANLPAQVGKTLQKRLEQADAWEEENKALKEENEALKKENKEMDDKMIDVKGREEMVIGQANANDFKSKELDEREMKLNGTINELKVTEAERRADQLMEVLGTVFKSPVYRRHYSESRETMNQYVGEGNEAIETGKNIQEEITHE